jgi:hypothetical protein
MTRSCATAIRGVERSIGRAKCELTDFSDLYWFPNGLCRGSPMELAINFIIMFI